MINWIPIVLVFFAITSLAYFGYDLWQSKADVIPHVEVNGVVPAIPSFAIQPHEPQQEQNEAIDSKIAINVPDSTLQVPNLDRPIIPLIPLSSLSEDEAKRNISSLKERLRQDQDDYASWIGLGIYRKTLGDYRGAEEVWKYVTVRWPTDYVAFNNLGNLYHEQLRDFQKAEENYRKAADLQPLFVQTYSNLHNLYRYSFVEKKDKAAEPLLLGLERNPTSINLMISLGRYYIDISDMVSATKYYKMAVQRAEIEKKSEMVVSLSKEARENGIEI